MAVSLSRPDPTSPASVAEAGFSTARRGFNPDEVRAFLVSVSTEMRRLNEQNRQLLAELTAAQNKARRPVQIDDSMVAEYLGEETTRVLQMARDSASSIKVRAEERAGELMREASTTAAETRRRSEVEAAQRRQEAESESQAIVAEAKAEGRAMVGEARAYRERVLADLERRTVLARQQLEELEHARQRLLQVFERARLVAIDVSTELEANRPPAEVVDLSAVTGPVPVIVPASKRPLPPRTARPHVDDADPARTGAAEAVSESDKIAGMTVTTGATAGETPASATIGTSTGEATSAAAPNAASAPDRRNVVDLFPGSQAGRGRTDGATKTAGPGDATGAADRGAVDADAEAGDVDAGADRQDRSDADLDSGTDTGTDSRSDSDDTKSGADAQTEAGVESGAEDANTDADGDGATDHADSGVADPVDDATDENTEPVTASTTTDKTTTDNTTTDKTSADVTAVENIDEVDAATTADEAATAVADEPDTAAGDRASVVVDVVEVTVQDEPSQEADTVGGLFERLRKGIEQSAEPALDRDGRTDHDDGGNDHGTVDSTSRSGSATSDTATGTDSDTDSETDPRNELGAVVDNQSGGDDAAAVAGASTPEPAEADATTGAASSETATDGAAPAAGEVIAGADGHAPVEIAAFVERDEQIEPTVSAVARAIKRQFGDEQNSALHHLGGNAPVDQLDDLISDAADQLGTYRLAVLDGLLDAAVAGAVARGASNNAATRSKLSAPRWLDPAQEILRESVVEVLRSRLEIVLREGNGDNKAIAKRLRSIYREVKTEHIDTAAVDMVRAAYGAGMAFATPKGTPQVWRIDERFETCPDCEDNSLAPPIAAGDEFPTGCTLAPAHPGCRCLVVPFNE